MGMPSEEYLESTDVVDWKNPAVLAKALELTRDCRDDIGKARVLFEWVKGEIKHSRDFELNPVTCSASDVLKHGTGFCFAKSHLLAAFLRANKIPAGFGYQRKKGADPKVPFYLHGFGAVYLPQFGWYHIDPRGDKPGVSTFFNPPVEKLAYTPNQEGEWDDLKVRPAPLKEVVAALRAYKTWDAFMANAPDFPSPPPL